MSNQKNIAEVKEPINIEVPVCEVGASGEEKEKVSKSRVHKFLFDHEVIRKYFMETEFGKTITIPWGDKKLLESEINTIIQACPEMDFGQNKIEFKDLQRAKDNAQLSVYENMKYLRDVKEEDLTSEKTKKQVKLMLMHSYKLDIIKDIIKVLKPVKATKVSETKETI